MKKYLLASFVVLSFIFYSLQQKNEDDSALAKLPVPSGGSTPNLNRTPTETTVPEPSNTSAPRVQPTKARTPLPTATSAPQSSGQYKNGTYTGDVADAYYGNIQVQATVRNGQITDVTFLQYPNDRNTSIEINSQAMPILKQEAITAQTAQVDVVSGATDTSQAFVESLASALNKAQ